ncbi:MAG TPA: hypothetical protein EYN73_09595 [Chromatiaceae bacterium]|jgi:hypothetical protein|nr:hypothetical protein [Chromatiaceae bacterium]HIN82086.1 hypothetical protein [Chromatiales bacterium]HIA09299.1 hypothetical protein [Chromatiaceae bacterium]HIB85223.1 hypothetical protein [Chromatiaceae bacterium]HIO14612.1 hypothetical protein [Chromatiales bacterium]
MNDTFVPANDLEEKLLAAQSGQSEGAEFIDFLLDSSVFIPVKDNQIVGAMQMSDTVVPLTVTVADAE